MSEQQKDSQEQDQKPVAGFKFSIPFFSAWGGETQVNYLMPTIRWILILVGTALAFKFISESFQ